MLWSIFMICSAYSGGSREIQIDYEHSMRIPKNEMSIHFTERNDIYQIEVLTKALDDAMEYKDLEIEKVILIDKEYFDSIYTRLLNLNFKELVMNSENILGADGRQISIKVGTLMSNVVLDIWTPKYDIEGRKTGNLYAILQEVFTKVGLEEWLES